MFFILIFSFTLKFVTLEQKFEQLEFKEMKISVINRDFQIAIFPPPFKQFKDSNL